jgi:hypothetical protein
MAHLLPLIDPGNSKTSCLIGLESAYDNLQNLFLSAKQTNLKQVKQEVNGTMILLPSSIP